MQSTQDGEEVDLDEPPTLLTALGPKNERKKRERRENAERREKREKRARAEENGSRDDRRPSPFSPSLVSQNILLTNIPGFFSFLKKATQMKVDSEPNGDVPQFSEAETFVLQGHESEVFSCAWNPRRSLLASG